MKQIAMSVLFILLCIMSDCYAGETKEVTPSDVFAVADLADRQSDVLLAAEGIRDARLLKKIENGLNPMHPYQMMVATIETVILLEKKEKLRLMPRVVASPNTYVPEDVRILGEMIVNELQRISEFRGIRDYPRDKYRFEGKVPTDVFGKLLDVFIKLRVLAGMEDISPNEAYSQMVRATSDVKSVLTRIDPAQRFRIDAPEDAPSDITPYHVFGICLQIRREINTLRAHLGLSVIPVPELSKDEDIRPSDVYIQTILIIAELNLLKTATGTVSSTPLAIPVSDKTPADTYHQAVMVKFLLSQVRPLQDMMKQLGK